MDTQGSKTQVAEKPTANHQNSRRGRKLTLLQDVDKLKRKLRHEENVHRALQRAFNRPLGALPRLPPYLPPYILELLAEVAVLEEEVARLEEQVLSVRHSLYQEAANAENSPDSKGQFLVTSLKVSGLSRPKLLPSIPRSASRRKLFPSKTVSHRMEHCGNTPMNGEQDLRKADSSSEDLQGKENQTCPNSMKDKKTLEKKTNVKTPGRKPPAKPMEQICLRS